MQIPTPAEIEAFRLGVAEATGNVGMTYDGDPESLRSVAYDVGRTIGELPDPWRTLLGAAPDSLAALRDLVAQARKWAPTLDRSRAHDAIVAATGSAP